MASEDNDQSKLFQKVPSDDPYFKMNEVAQQMNNVPKSWMVSPSECSTNFDLVVVYWHIIIFRYEPAINIMMNIKHVKVTKEDFIKDIVSIVCKIPSLLNYFYMLCLFFNLFEIQLAN